MFTKIDIRHGYKITPKIVQFCDDLQKIPTISSYPIIYTFLKLQKLMKFNTLNPPKWLRIYMKISEHSPARGGGQSDRQAEDWHADKQAYWQAGRYMYTC